MKEYSSPKIKFESMELFEKIADTCWGYGHAWWKGLDKNGNLVKVEASWNSGCKGGLPDEFMTALIGANVDITQFHNNIANTKDKGFTPVEPS